MEEFPKLINSHDDSIIAVNNSTFSIGRSLSCDHIINSLGVSRFHCIIKKHDDKWTLYDRSSNGTLVNSTLCKFNESLELKQGDVIRLGPDNQTFTFYTQPPKVEEPLEAEVIQEFAQPFDNTPKQESQEKQEGEMMEDELTCSICSELFIKAVTLNCSHTFCKMCLEQWKKQRPNCPICRKPIVSVAPTLVLDNFIEKYVSKQSEEAQKLRKSIIEQREQTLVSVAGSSTSGEVQVIEIHSDYEEDNDDLDDYEESDYSGMSDEDYDDIECYARSSGRAYYGGYGRCYICNEPGHWANGCPLRGHRY